MFVHVHLCILCVCVCCLPPGHIAPFGRKGFEFGVEPTPVEVFYSGSKAAAVTRHVIVYHVSFGSFCLCRSGGALPIKSLLIKPMDATNPNHCFKVSVRSLSLLSCFGLSLIG